MCLIGLDSFSPQLGRSFANRSRVSPDQYPVGCGCKDTAIKATDASSGGVILTVMSIVESKTVETMFRILELRGGAFPERAYDERAAGHLPEIFNRLIVTDGWEVDMDTAQVMMGERARLLHHIPEGNGRLGLADLLSAYKDEHAREVARLIEHAIETTAPFFYAAVLAEAPCDTIVGVGEPIGNKISGVFLAARYPSFSNAG